MSISKKRAGLVLLVALSMWTPSGHVVGQELRGPIDVLFAFVREKVAVAVPPEQRPYDPARMFLRVGRGVSDRSVLGPLEKRNLGRLGITLADDKADASILNSINAAYVRDDGDKADVLVFDSVSGAYVRDDGVYVVIRSADRADRGALAIGFDYYVTSRQSGRKSSLCYEEWRIVLRPADRRDGGWQIGETDKLGHC